MGVFHVFKNVTNGTKSCNDSHTFFCLILGFDFYISSFLFKRLDVSDVYNNDVSVSQFLISYCKIIQSARGDINEEEVVDDLKETEEYSDSEETEEKIPLHFKLVIKVYNQF